MPQKRAPRRLVRYAVAQSDAHTHPQNARSEVPHSPDGTDWQTFDRLLGALARFSTQMISVYAEQRESLPEDAQEAFDLCLLDWQAVSSELVVYEPVVPGGGQVDAAA